MYNYNNANLPPIPVIINNRFLCGDATKHTAGHLISVRALYGQALQFSVLLEDGALFTGLPAHAITFSQTENLSLQECQMYDNIGDKIELFVMETLRYAKCTIKDVQSNIHEGIYLFTIDFVGKLGLEYNPEQWKQFHCIRTNEGRLLVYPQYRIRFLDSGLCPNTEGNYPQYIANKNHWIIGS
jgi:hypothetical protein